MTEKRLGLHALPVFLPEAFFLFARLLMRIHGVLPCFAWRKPLFKERTPHIREHIELAALVAEFALNDSFIQF